MRDTVYRLPSSRGGVFICMKQPHIYTLPERFIKDPAVPFRWKLYTILNGFWIAGKPVFASNAWFAEKLGCSDRTVREGLLELEGMYLITRHGSSQKRRIIPGGHGDIPESERVGTQSATQGGTAGAVGAELLMPHIADSNSVKDIGVADAPQIVEVKEDSEERPKTKPKYPNAKTVFSWFPKPEPSWKLNTTQLKHAELLWLRGEDKVRAALKYVSAHKDDENFYQVLTPQDLESKWVKIAAYAKRNN